MAEQTGLRNTDKKNWVEKLLLRALTVEELYGLLQVRLDARLLRPVLKRLHETSGGNPFYALEIGRALQRREAWGTTARSLPLPDDVGDLVRERLAVLPPAARKAVQVASMISESTVSALRAVIGEGTTEALLAASRLGVIDF